MTRRRVEGLRVLLTGASSGIGKALAVELAGRGARLLMTARRIPRLSELAGTLQQQGAECSVLAGDLTDPQHRAALVETAVARMGGLDVLLNCAGIGALGRFDEAGPERLREVFEVNFFAAAELIRVALPALKQGRTPIIVNISSVLGHRAVPLKSEYCASKFALHGFSDSLRAELKPLGVDVLLVSPSTTDSDFFDSAVGADPGRNWKGRHPMSPERVANIAVRALRMGRSEVILSWGGTALVWLDRLSPPLANFLIARFSRQ